MVITPASPRFRRLLLHAIFVPVLLMILIAVVLIGQITHLLRDSADVERADRFIAKTGELQRLTVDLETGLRGYLITGDERFLDPYHHAITVVDQASGDVLNGTDDPAVKQQIRELDSRRKTWLDYAKPLIELRKRNGDYTSVVTSLEGKRQMDQMRDQFRQLISAQSQIRDDRFRDAVIESRVTLIAVAGVALLGGAVLAALSRNQFIKITGAYDAALRSTKDLNQTLEQRVSERTRELQQRSAELVEANRELEAFSYSISHDLRAPMRHISGFANLLDKAAAARLTDSERENLTIIRDTANLAGRMVDELLSFSRVGRATILSVPVDLNALVTDCLRELRPDTKDRIIDWKLSTLPTVQGDPALLKMVLTNLLSNAIKYTSRQTHAAIEVGSGEVPATEAAAAGRSDLVMCFVRDNGVGFSMEYVGKLFGVFQRLHRAEEFEGTGIGLANVRRIITRLGGRVWAEGELNRGATFYFTVPIAVKDA